MNRAVRLIAVIATFALLTAACSKSSTTSESPSGSPLPGVGMTGCEVTDTGGIDDRSFNATAYKGLTDAQQSLGITPSYLESTTQQDYVPNIEASLAKGCNLIVTVGFLLGDATESEAKANPSQPFTIVDFAYSPTIKNVLGLTFGTDQAAFLAGYLAAGMTKSGKVGTFGGINIPPVTIFMNGFAAGIGDYNKENGTHVKLLGWNADKQDGTFTGDFDNQDKGKNVTQELISEGADIILPVAGPVGLGAAAAAQDAGNVSMIWVDVDGCVSAPNYCPLFLTSIEKNMDVAVEGAMKDVVDGTFTDVVKKSKGVYTGTLGNGGVGIAPYHDWQSKIPSDLQSKIDQLKQGIVDGSVSVDPTDYLNYL